MTETPRWLTFGANADAYERARPDWPADAVAWLVPGAPRVVVELGAGTGKLTRALAVAGRHVVAVEPDERMLAVVSGLGLAGVDAVQGSAESLPVADGTADAVVAGSSIHWFDLERALAEAHRVLRPAGTFAFGWNHRDASDPAMARIDAAIRTGGGSRSSWRGRGWPELVTAAGLFGSVEQRTFHHVLELPHEALDDHLRSYATIASRPAAARSVLVDRVAAIIEEEPSLHRGGRLTLPFVVEGFRARRS